MNLLSFFLKQTVVGHFLGESVFEHVFQIREKDFLVYELNPLKMMQTGFYFLAPAGDGL